FDRGWRPIAFPAMSAPFFLLTGGQILLSVGLVQLCATLILATYIHRILSLELPADRALIGALLVTSAAWLVNFSMSFYSELVWLSFAAPTAFHLLLATRQVSKAHYVLAGIWFGLMGTIRPIETVIIGGLPGMVLAIREMLCGSIHKRDLTFFLLQLVAVGAMVGIMVGAEPSMYFAAGLGLIAASMIVATRL